MDGPQLLPSCPCKRETSVQRCCLRHLKREVAGAHLSRMSITVQKSPRLIFLCPLFFYLQNCHFLNFHPFATLNMSTRNTSYSSYNAEATRPSSATDSDTTTLFGTDCWQKQVLPTPYINRKRLLAKLRSRYGENGFRVQVCSSSFISLYFNR